MLIQPPSQTPFRLLSLDPGTSDLGVSLIEVAFPSNTCTITNAFTLKAGGKKEGFGSIEELHGGRIARIQYLGEELDKILLHNKPHAVISEAPFMGRFANAYRALTEILWMLRDSVYNYDPYLPLYTIDPVTVKSSIGITKRKDMSDKSAVTRHLAKHKGLTWQIDLDQLDEHSVDAVAVGVYYVFNLL